MKAKLVRAALLSILIVLAGCAGQSADVEDRREAVETYVQLGLNYLGSGQRDQARFNLLKALEMDKKAPNALHGMALLYQSEGEADLADEHYRKALRQDRNFTQARMNYARFLFLEERYDEARDHYAKVAENPNYRLRPQAFVGLALSHQRLGNQEASKQALDRALQLNPGLSSALMEAAEIAYEEERYDLARDYLKRFESSAQQTPRSLWLGVRLARQANDKDRAASYGLALLEIYPDSSEADKYRQSR